MGGKNRRRRAAGLVDQDGVTQHEIRDQKLLREASRWAFNSFKTSPWAWPRMRSRPHPPVSPFDGCESSGDAGPPGATYDPHTHGVAKFVP